MNSKPKHRSGYSAPETDLVRSACLTIAVTLGGYLNEMVIVGGLVPTLLIDLKQGRVGDAEDLHAGTNDLDLGLSLALLDDQRYEEVSQRLRDEGFEPSKNQAGNLTVQRWQGSGLLIDFLMPPTSPDQRGGSVQNLESDFGALITPGLELAFDDRVFIDLSGTTLGGDPVSRQIPVCGSSAFVVLKALAFDGRGEEKDAYDLVYVLRNEVGGAEAVAQCLNSYMPVHANVIDKAKQILNRDFADMSQIGPRRAARFEYEEPTGIDNASADAHGFVTDFLMTLN